MSILHTIGEVVCGNAQDWGLINNHLFNDILEYQLDHQNTSGKDLTKDQVKIMVEKWKIEHPGAPVIPGKTEDSI